MVAISKTNMSLSLLLPLAATDIGFVPRVTYNHTKHKSFYVLFTKMSGRFVSVYAETSASHEYLCKLAERTRIL